MKRMFFLFLVIFLVSSSAIADSIWDRPCFKFIKNGNLRSGPNTKAEIIGKKVIGDIVCFIRYAKDDPKSSWYSFTDNGGKVYYFHKSLGRVYATRGAAEYAGKQAGKQAETDAAEDFFDGKTGSVAPVGGFCTPSYRIMMSICEKPYLSEDYIRVGAVYKLIPGARIKTLSSKGAFKSCGLMLVLIETKVDAL